eukprot:CAMPEP_0119003646 /NCGR_PEP_ID=MMETSP1176-20130426/685_1 /TAXON_ID=265551 /ORGANISM="Synedropsis recta cf, Strain CCMP1620" /LENGTH=674 /DNA_ID=CAMNT_0006955263 /DNA_START=102 /DNA_END=2126 /DNA_ORIENTATION=-
MSDERDEIDAQTADGVLVVLAAAATADEKLESVPDDQQEEQDPPLVTATLIVPMIELTTTIVNDAEAVLVVDDGSMMVMTTQQHHAAPQVVLFDPDGASSTATATATATATSSTSDYVESTSVPVPSSSRSMDPAAAAAVPSSYVSCQSSRSSSSYTTESTLSTTTTTPAAVVHHELVQIDALEDSDRSSSFAVAEQQEKDRFDRLHHYCRIYLAIALLLFLAGVIGMISAVVHFGKLEPNNNNQQQGGLPVVILLPPNTPSMAVPTTPPVLAPAAPPTTSKPSVSLSPSQMPSCSGNYAQVATVQVAQSGSNFFTMSDRGGTIVVANFHYQLSKSFLETFVQSSNGNDNTVTRSESNDQGFSIVDMLLSGDGSRLVLGVNSYPQSEDGSNVVGGALLLLDKIDLDANDSGTVEWRTRHTVLTQGGFYGAVVNVATSSDGTTVAFVAKNSDDDGNDVSIEVHREQLNSSGETRELVRLGQRLSQAAFDANTVAELSGNGMRLFVVTNDNQVQVFELDEQGEWHPLGETIVYDGSAPQVHPSYNGTIVALGSKFQFPVVVFEERTRSNDDEGTDAGSDGSWHEVGKLDITTSSEAQHVAISGDGRNVVVGEKFANEQTVARLFRRSGSGFAQLQDMMLPGGNFRGMSLDMGGEQLVAAVEETVATYRKDCSGGRL